MGNKTKFFKTISKVVKEERKICEDIFLQLDSKRDLSINEFGEFNNLLNIFFYDILKLFTHILLKDYENRNKLNLKEFDHLTQHKWPYVSHNEIKQKKIVIQNKIFGKTFESKYKIILKNLYINFLNLKNLPIKRKTIFLKGVGITKKDLKEFSNLKIKTLFLQNNKIYLENYDLQLQKVSSYLNEIIEGNEILCSLRNLDAIIVSHIDSFISRKKIKSKRNLAGDIVICSSGIELDTRFIRDQFKKNNGKVVNVIHGGSSGVLDEPLWGDVGDNYLADYVIGYGNCYRENFEISKFQKNKNYIYKYRNPLFEKIYNQSKKAQQSNELESNYYFPTTLRGGNFRHGPYQDIPDSIYLAWQDELYKLFGGNLITKMHPKEKFSFLYNNKQCKKVTGKFEDIMNDANLLVFDYFSTIFVEACATQKSVVFFDLGIRNINKLSLEKIKKRVIYFDILNDGFPDYAEIEKRIITDKIDNDFIKSYSISKKINITSNSIAHLVNEII